jgi:hypothetical protein
VIAPNEALQRTAATVMVCQGRKLTVVAAAAELGRSALGVLCLFDMLFHG